MTTTTTTTRNHLTDAAEYAGVYEYEFRTYSGRGMYGKGCLGIVTDSAAYAYAIMTAHAMDLVEHAGDFAAGEDVLNAIRGARTDSMGLDTIVYFPRIAFDEEA